VRTIAGGSHLERCSYRLLLGVVGGVRLRCFRGNIPFFQHLTLFDVVLIAFQLGDSGQTTEGLAISQTDQADTLGITARRAHLIHTGTHQGALVGNQHDIFFAEHLGGTNPGHHDL